MKKQLYIRFLSCALVLFAVYVPAFAHPGGINTPNPNLPPAGVYLSPQDVHAMYSGADLAIVLSAIQHQPFVPGIVDYVDNDEFHHFNSAVQGEITCYDNDPGSNACALNGLPPGVPVIGTLVGPVSTVAHGKPIGTTTGTFDTEMLSMSLSGVGSTPPFFKIREAAANESIGVTSITDIGGGMYHIDSFFDVFTELSLDGGQTWIPKSGLRGTRVNLGGVPEPASALLMAFGILGFAGLARSRR